MTALPVAGEAAVGKAVEAIRQHAEGPFPKTALILGSGLGEFGEGMASSAVIPYGDIPGFPQSTVAGHAGRLLVGSAAGHPLVCMQGRLHVYEGHDPRQIALPIRTLRQLGVEVLIITNAAGGMRADLPAGALMMIEDHINYSGRNPLIGPNDDTFGPRFFDMGEAYDPALRTKLRSAAELEQIDLKTGVYLYTTGPNFETPAEIRAFAALGADAVGMSTVPECLVARHCGLKVVGLSLITNLAAGLSKVELSHQETMDEAAKAFDKINRLLLRFLRSLD